MMKILPEKELAIKKAIIKAVETGHSAAVLAESFSVSKSTIYKYRRILKDQGFIKKNENGVYVITTNKFSTQAQSVATAELPLENTLKQDNATINDTPKNNNDIDKTKHNYKHISEVPTGEAMEQRLQNKITEMRNTFEKINKGQGFIKKLLNRLKKS